MPSRVQSLLTSIMCCVIAFGHAPAWLHVATCDDGCGTALLSNVASPVADAETSVSACPHGCCHHAAKVDLSSEAQSPTDLPSKPSDHHDSDTCAVCQSLAGSNGVVSFVCASLALEYLCEPAFICADRAAVEASISIAQPRGPPALA